MCKHNENNGCAKEKVKFMFGCLLFVVAVGGVWEILKSQAPLDSVVVVYNVKKNVEYVVEVKEPEKHEEVVVNENVEEKVVVEEVKKEIENKSLKNEQAMEEFLGYLKQIKSNVEGVSDKEFVLDKIKIDEKKEDVVNDVSFKNGQIEVYDSDKGIVDVIIEEKVDEVLDVISEEKINEKVNEEISVEVVEEVIENHESLNNDVVLEEVIENKEENSAKDTVEEEGETVNLMESIITNQ